MGLRAIYVLTHDSIGLGEDGPTHQPVEHANALRVIPNCSVWRPCDAAETAAAWLAAVERTDGPTCLLLTRQGVPPQTRSAAQLEDIRRGGYVLLEPAGGPEAIVIATGSEVAVAVAAANALNAAGRRIRVVSMPCADVFLAQPAAYREAVLPAQVRLRVAIEAGSPDYWYRFVGLDGDVIGLSSFGASAPAGALFDLYGFTAQAVETRLASYLEG
jgi:transketolase